MTKVFIDGSAGTAGLRIHSRLENRADLELVTLSGEARKDPAARRAALNSCDLAVLCLPDAASRESVAMIENPAVRVVAGRKGKYNSNVYSRSCNKRGGCGRTKSVRAYGRYSSIF